VKKLEKVVHGDWQWNPITRISSMHKHISQCCISKQSTIKTKIAFPALPAPKNIGIYNPCEAHSI
jgi:hypothetical protein